MVALLISALLMFHDTEPFEPIDNNIKVSIKFYDWAFIEAQELWVMDTVSINNKEVIKNAIPLNIKKLIKQLGSNCYKCREIACKKLKNLPNQDYIWMFWAYSCGDLETQKHAYHIISSYAICKHEPSFYCQSCRGTNQYWPLRRLQMQLKRLSVLESDIELPNGDVFDENKW